MKTIARITLEAVNNDDGTFCIIMTAGDRQAVKSDKVTNREIGGLWEEVYHAAMNATISANNTNQPQS